MSRSVTGYGVARGGKAIVSHRARLDEEFAAAFKEGERFCVTFEKETRTLAQNRRLWRMNDTIGRQVGMSKEDVHAASVLALNQKHATYLDKTSGELVDLVFGGTTHDMSITAMQDYQERFVRYWAMRGYDALYGDNEQEYAPVPPSQP